MPLLIGGNTFNASPFLDQQRYEQEQLRRAAEEAQARNDAQASRSANSGAQNFQYNQQQDAQAQQHAQQAAALAHQYAQQDLENARSRQSFDRAGQWHDQEQQQQQAAIHAQAAHQAQEMELRNRQLSQQDTLTRLRLSESEEAKQAAVQAHKDQARTQYMERVMSHAARVLPDSTPDEQFRYAMEEAVPLHGAPQNDPEGYAYFLEKTQKPQMPEYPTGADEQAMDNPAPTFRERLADTQQRNRHSTDLRQQTEERVSAYQATQLERQQRLDAETAERREHPERQMVEMLRLKREIEPLLDNAPEDLQYEYAKASGKPRPQNRLFQEELKFYNEQAKVQQGILGDPITTGMYLWMRAHAESRNPSNLKGVLMSIKEALKPSANTVTPPPAAPTSAVTPPAPAAAPVTPSTPPARPAQAPSAPVAPRQTAPVPATKPEPPKPAPVEPGSRVEDTANALRAANQDQELRAVLFAATQELKRENPNMTRAEGEAMLKEVERQYRDSKKEYRLADAILSQDDDEIRAEIKAMRSKK